MCSCDDDVGEPGIGAAVESCYAPAKRLESVRQFV